MTTTPDTVLGSDLEFLTPSEQEHATALRRDSENALSLTEVGLALGGGFLFYRLYMTKRLRREIRGGVTATQLAAATEYHFRKFLPIWSFITIPAMVRAMIMGSPEQGLPDEIIFALADDYSRRVGGYINDSSKESLMEGFNSYVNKRQNRVLAANKALDGFGLTKRQTRALVAKKDRPPVSSTRSVSIDRDRELYVEQAAFSRALTVGDNEAYAATQHGKQIGWMFLQKEGRISSDAKRMWITARDERVCKACGPMHRKTAKIDEPFETPNGDVWAPSLHPNCRCTMALRGMVKSQFALAKDLYGSELADFNRKIRRADDGRFTFKPKVKEREVDPSLDEILRQATALKAEPEKISLNDRISLGKPKVSLTPKISLGGNISMESSGVSVPQATIPKIAIPALALEQIALQADKIALLPPVRIVMPTRTERPKAAPADIAKPLETEVLFHDSSNALWYDFDVEDEVLDTPEGQAATLNKNQHFYGWDDTWNEKTGVIPVSYSEVIERLTREVINRGTYGLKDPHNGSVLPLPPETIKRVVEAEIKGDPDHPQVREMAKTLGISRSAYVSRVYSLSSVYKDADVSDPSNVTTQGPYVVDYVSPIPENGYPVQHVYMRPMNAAEFEEWLVTEGHQGD